MLRLLKIAHKLPIASLSGRAVSQNQIRCLFSREELGIVDFARARTEVKKFLGNVEFYKANFAHKFLNDEDCFYEDLKNGLKDFIFIIENTELDIVHLKEALTLLAKKQNEYAGDKFRFGPVIMRALYYLDMPDEAIAMFEDDVIGQLFPQFTSHQILFDMLYEHKMYEDILRLYDNLNEEAQLYKFTTVIILATYYQLNTPKSLEQAYSLWKKMTYKNDKHQFRKSLTFVAGLAIKQKQPKIALEVLRIYEDYPKNFYFAVREIKLLAWAQIGHYDKVLNMFRTILERHKQKQEKDQLTSIKTLDDIQELVHINGIKQNIDEFLSLRNEIETLKLVTDKTLDNTLCMPFPARKSGGKFQNLSGVLNRQK
ncbi:uncharacterized protein LOC116346825 [Contarinia nasturtii]|uniref:uncharacterized protein LOC116346825 n=1 Tax=Contarinia nasturtii TaxID=265458 RepID=UPI0012D37A77|nr:uncharacterized protein LOC116346825 [Contarinia nasturtii]